MSPHETALGPVARAGAGTAPRPSVSFEFSPPKTPEAEASLWEAIRRLEPLNPSFVSVTYGAGGSTRDRTHRTVVRMLKETSLKPAAHLTCVEASKAEVDEVVQAYWDAGIRHIVALRGDPDGLRALIHGDPPTAIRQRLPLHLEFAFAMADVEHAIRSTCYHEVMDLAIDDIAAAHRQFLQGPMAACIAGMACTARNSSRSASTADASTRSMSSGVRDSRSSSAQRASMPVSACPARNSAWRSTRVR